MNPFLAFCLYVAARVLTHAYKKRPDDQNIKSNLHFLLIAMQAHRKKNQLTESFLIQLTVELEAAGLENPLAGTSFRVSFSIIEDLLKLTFFFNSQTCI
jgi:hypothetical protein